MYIPFLGGDPIKRKKNLKFLGKVALLGLVVYVGAFLIQGELSQGDPLKTCIDNRETPYRISVTMELFIDGNDAPR